MTRSVDLADVVGTVAAMGWVVEADRERCMGSGACAFAAPEIFSVDGTGRVVILGPVTVGDERVRDAVADCPLDALRLIEDLT